jgi:hypothetical protein
VPSVCQCRLLVADVGPLSCLQLPIGISFSADMAKSFISIAFVGHLGTDYLAAASIASVGALFSCHKRRSELQEFSLSPPARCLFSRRFG